LEGTISTTGSFSRSKAANASAMPVPPALERSLHTEQGQPVPCNTPCWRAAL